MNSALLIIQIISALSREPATVPVQPQPVRVAQAAPVKVEVKPKTAKIVIEENRCDGVHSVCWFYPDTEEN